MERRVRPVRVPAVVGLVAAVLLLVAPAAHEQTATPGTAAMIGPAADRQPTGPPSDGPPIVGGVVAGDAPSPADGLQLSAAPAARPGSVPRAVGPVPGAGIPAPGAGYAWPLLPPPAVLAPFRAPTHAYGPGHRGVDLAGYTGGPVLAARAGSVVFAGPVAGHGVVSVQHDDGLRTTYEPVSPTVAAGAVVQAGDALGRLDPGHAGCPGAVCLHWGVRRDRLDYLDPLVLLRPTRVRLLPVPDPWPDGDPPAPTQPESGLSGDR